MSSSVGKIVAERNRRTLLELVLKPGNDVCADCKARAPRWASYNLGIFICMTCASIHRKIGTHVTKVKSITLDEWSKEQVEVMKEQGNIKSNTLYNPNEARHPPPTNMIDSERDSELEVFIRSKYEFKRFMDRKSGITSQQLLSAGGTVSTPLRLQSTPPTGVAHIERKTSPGPLPPPKTPENMPPRHKLHPSTFIPSPPSFSPMRSVSQPLPPLTAFDKLTAAPPLRQPGAIQTSVEKPVGQVWEDLISLQEPSHSSSLPLQYGSMPQTASLSSQAQLPMTQPMTLSNALNPFSHLSLNQVNPTTTLSSSISGFTTGTHSPFVPSPHLSSPALHLSATNPFNQTPLLLSSAANVSGTALATSANSFSSSPSAQPVMARSAGTLLHTPPTPYGSSQTSTPAPSFPPSPFIPVPAYATASLGNNPFTPATPGQIPLAANGAMNPFSAMQMEQPGFPAASPQTAFGTTAFLGQQQQPGPTQRFGGWVGQGLHGTF